MYTDFKTFMHDYGFDRIFRMRNKQSNYGSTLRFVKIIDVIELPDKDILLGFKEFFTWEEQGSESFQRYPIYYKKLSEVELVFYADDMDMERCEGEMPELY